MSCTCTKVPYASPQAAHTALSQVRRKRFTKRHAGRSEQRAYKCDACSQWHLTSKTR